MSDTGETVQRQAGERVLLAGVRLLVRIFFRELEVIGAELVPRDRGGLLVAWHPNGLVDPAVLTAAFPGRVVYGAKHVMFRWPVFGLVLRAFGTVPLYRASDEPGMTDEQRRAGNARSLEALAEKMAAGYYAALFPEGVSHDLPHLAPLRSGVARLYFQVLAAQSNAAATPAIIPVGLHYDDKHLFRSRVLVRFYPPLRPEAALAQDPDRNDKLTRQIESALEEAIRPTADWTTHRLINRSRKIIRVERARRAGVPSTEPTFAEKIEGFARVQHAYTERLLSHPEEAAELRRDVAEYDAKLTALGLDDHELDHNPPLRGFWFMLLTLLQLVFVLLLLPPLVLLGYAVNGPPALIVWAITRFGANDRATLATQKIFAGAVLFPLTWIATVFLGAAAHEWIAARYQWLPDRPLLFGVTLAVLSVVGAAHVVRYQAEARQTIRNIRVRFRRARQAAVIASALAERAAIFDRMMSLAEGLQLPDDTKQ